MPQMKLFGNSRSAARVAGKRKPDSEQAPKEKKQKKKKPLKVLAVWLTVILCLEGLYFFCCYTNNAFVAKWRTIYIQTAMSTMRHQWMATYLLPEPVIDEVLQMRIQAAEAVGDKESSWSKEPETTTPAEPVEPAIKPIDTTVTEMETETMTPEDEQALAKEAFYEMFWELDQATMEAYVEQNPSVLDNGWENININEAGLDDNGTSIMTTMGEQVLAIDAPNKILFVRVKGSGWRGVLAIAKDPSLLCIGTSANISQGTDPFSKGSGQTVGEIVQNVEGGILGITASGFIDVSPNGVLGQGNGGRLAGYCMAQGTEYNVDYHATNSGWHKFSRMELHDDNLMYIKATTDPISENCTDAFEFEPAMIVDGEVLVNEWWSELNPRSCIGQSDKYEILMLVIEGRGASGSWGTDIAHCAEIQES